MNLFHGLEINQNLRGVILGSYRTIKYMRNCCQLEFLNGVSQWFTPYYFT